MFKMCFFQDSKISSHKLANRFPLLSVLSLRYHRICWYKLNLNIPKSSRGDMVSTVRPLISTLVLNPYDIWGMSVSMYMYNKHIWQSQRSISKKNSRGTICKLKSSTIHLKLLAICCSWSIYRKADIFPCRFWRVLWHICIALQQNFP